MKNIQKISAAVMGAYMLAWMGWGGTAWEHLSIWINGGADNAIAAYSRLTFRWLIGPYLLFAVGTSLKAFFIGTGRPFWIFMASAVVNGAVFLPLGWAVRKSVIQLTYTDFLAITAAAFVVDFLLVAFFLWRWGYRQLER